MKKTNCAAREAERGFIGHTAPGGARCGLRTLKWPATTSRTAPKAQVSSRSLLATSAGRPAPDSTWTLCCAAAVSSGSDPKGSEARNQAVSESSRRRSSHASCAAPSASLPRFRSCTRHAIGASPSSWNGSCVALGKGAAALGGATDARRAAAIRAAEATLPLDASAWAGAPPAGTVDDRRAKRSTLVGRRRCCPGGPPAFGISERPGPWCCVGAAVVARAAKVAREARLAARACVLAALAAAAEERCGRNLAPMGTRGVSTEWGRPR